MSTRMLQNNRLNYRIQSLHVGMQPPGSSVTGEHKKCLHMLGKKFDWFQTGRNIHRRNPTAAKHRCAERCDSEIEHSAVAVKTSTTL